VIQEDCHSVQQPLEITSHCYAISGLSVVITVGHLPRTTQMSQYSWHFLTQIRVPRGEIQGVPVAQPLQDLIRACLFACLVTLVFFACLDNTTVYDPPSLTGLALASHHSSWPLMTSFPSMVSLARDAAWQGVGPHRYGPVALNYRARSLALSLLRVEGSAIIGKSSTKI